MVKEKEDKNQDVNADGVELSVETKDLSLWFGENQVLRDITLQLETKEITAIIGPSGCGKSTMLRCFNRMNDLIEGTKITGSILIDGEDIYAPKTDICSLRSKVGMVFQRPNPFPKSIYDNIAYGLRLKGMKDNDQIYEKVKLSLEQAWLWDEVKDRLKASAFSLSGGQQQRLCIARALATDPEILLFDEPTSALDPQSTSKVEDLLVQELRGTITSLIVTHNIGQAGRVSKYTVFLYLGELIEFGETKEMFDSPQKKQTADYLRGKFG